MKKEITNKLLEASAKFLGRNTSSMPLQETAGSKKKDQLYAADEEHRNYDTHIEHIDNALHHSEEQGYKVNHEGYDSPHKHPDVTFHYARGDDEPHAYTVHHDGAAARDKVLHVRSIHQGDAESSNN